MITWDTLMEFLNIHIIKYSLPCHRPSSHTDNIYHLLLSTFSLSGEGLMFY